MLSNRAVIFASQVVFVLVTLVNTGSSLPKSDDKWRPVSFAATSSRMHSRRSLEQQEDAGRASSWIPSTDSAEYRILQKVFDDCIKSEDGATCLKSKAVAFLDRVGRLESIPLFTGVSLARQEKGIAETPTMSEAELETSLPRDLSHKSDTLDQMIYDGLTNFLDSHTLVMDFSEQAAAAEGRRHKKKKMLGFLMMGLAAAAATIGPLAFKSLAALAFKALIVAKVALVLSSVVALKKLVHHDSHGRSFSEDNEDSWVATSNGRSFSESTTEQAHKLAYGAQLQRPITVT